MIQYVQQKETLNSTTDAWEWQIKVEGSVAFPGLYAMEIYRLNVVAVCLLFNVIQLLFI